jgi:hypothetical protein
VDVYNCFWLYHDRMGFIDIVVCVYWVAGRELVVLSFGELNSMTMDLLCEGMRFTLMLGVKLCA